MKDKANQRKSTNFKTIERLILVDIYLGEGNYTLEKMSEMCNKNLDIQIEVRTIKDDIRRLRQLTEIHDVKIKIHQRKFYGYSQKDFSFFGNPLSLNDIQTLNEIQLILSQLKHYSASEHVNEMLKKLKKRNYSIELSNENLIVLEQNKQLKGLEFFDEIAEALIKKKVLEIEYRDFENNTPKYHIIIPLQLRQNKNRWLLIGKNYNNLQTSFLSLDRIVTCSISDEKYKNIPFDVNNYFKDMIGVSIPENETPVTIKLWFAPLQAKYQFTKPIHTSLTEIKTTKTGTIAQLTVKPNYELYQWILSMGENVKVLSPKTIQSRIIEKLENTLLMYQKE